MKITLLVVGKTTNNALDSLIADYQKRLTHYADRATLGIVRSGVYLLRLLGKDMKTQKIVVK